MKKPPIVSWDSTIMAEEFLSVTQPSLGQLTNLTKELSSSHGEREASRVQSTRLDSATTAHQAKSSVAGRLSQKYYNRKTREMTGPHSQPPIAAQKSVRKIDKRWS